MKTNFALQWLRSIQPRKQRKFRFNAPHHIRGSFLNAKLSKELREKHKVTSVRVRTEDKVKVLRGQFKGTTGAVTKVDLGRTRIYVSGAELVKKEGSKVPYPIHPSNVIITSVTTDKKRFQEAK
jgi:large subunit ribosomal protein L24